MAEGEGSEPLPMQPVSTNPGPYDELSRKCKEVFPMCFDGAKVMVQKGLNSHFQVSHTLSISQMNTGYRFGATYVGSKQLGPTESFPIILGDTDVNGNTSATIIHQWKNNIRMKLQSQVQQGQLSAVQASFEHRGKLATTSATFANIDLVNESGIILTQYLRKLSERFDIGAEMVYHYGKNIPGEQASILSYAARYTHKFWTGTMTLGTGGLNLSYYHKQHPDLAFGVEFETSFRAQESVATFAYQTEIPDEGIVMRASVDTNWSVGAVFEKRLSQYLPFTLALSGMINHAKAAGRFGVGLIIG